VCFLWVTAPNSVPSTRVCFLRVTARFSCPGSNGPPSSVLYFLHICEHSSLVSSQHNKHQWVSGLEMMMTPSVQHCGASKIQSSTTIFPVLDKRDFKSMCDVRKYEPNQTVNWPRCAHGEFCVMRVYQGWNNSGRRFWHCSQAWVSKTPWPLSFIILWFTNVITVSIVLRPTR
jgi:hypothetical protein